MPKYLHIPCPNCQHPLRVREQYIGIEVTCIRCDHSFLVRAPDESPSTAERPAKADHEACELRLNEARAELEQLRRELATAVAEGENRSESIQRLTDECAVHSAKSQELENALGEARQQLGAAADQISQFRNQLDEHSASDSRHDLELKRLTEERDHAIARAQAAESELGQLRSAEPPVPDHSECERQLNETRDELNRVRDELTAAVAVAQTPSDELQRLTGECAVHSAKSQELENALSESRQQLDDAADQISQFKNQLDEHSASDSRHDLELKRLTEERDHAVAQAQAAESELGQLRSAEPPVPDHSECERQLNETRDELNRIRDELAAAVAEAKAPSDELQQLTGESAEHDSKSQELEDALTDTRQQLEVATQRIGELESNLDGLTTTDSQRVQELNQLIAERDQAESRARAAEDELTQLREQADEPVMAELADLDERDHELAENSDELGQQFAAWVAEHQNDHGSPRRHNDQATTHAARISELENQLFESEQRHTAATNRIQELERSLDELSASAPRADEWRSNDDEFEQPEPRVHATQTEADRPIDSSGPGRSNADPRVADLTEQLNRAMSDNEALREMIRGLGISVD